MAFEYSEEYEEEALMELEGLDLMKCKEASKALHVYLVNQKDISVDHFINLVHICHD